ncbi:MAG: AAA family ATPase, partial [Terriglobia bacterium]
MKTFIKSIKAGNFKSFKSLEVPLGQFNVLIGANASGKSNFVNVFRFLKNIASFGLDNAVSMRGGIEFLRNLAIGAGEDVWVEVIFGPDPGRMPGKMVIGHAADKFIGLERSGATYKLAIRSHKTGSSFVIAEDQLIQKGEFYLLHAGRARAKSHEEKLGPGELMSSIVSGSVKTSVRLEQDNARLSIKNARVLWDQWKVPPRASLLGAPFTGISLGNEVSVYDFEPKLPQKAALITGKAELEEDGSNLAIVLQNILR